MFTITVQDGEIVALCFSDWEVEPHRGKLCVSLLNTDKRILPSSFKYHLVIRWCVHIYICGLDFNGSLRGTNDRVPAPCFVVCYTAVLVSSRKRRGAFRDHTEKKQCSRLLVWEVNGESWLELQSLTYSTLVTW